MKNLKIVLFTLAAALMMTSVFAAETQKQLQREAKISMKKARSIALKKAPGTIESGELEREHGKLIYSFDIRTSKSSITEVNVDATNGKIVAVQQENAAKEAGEKKQEAQEKKTTPATTTTKH
jgi:Peptidase propeptide and YPEB domain